jgi:hypothetical protein
MPSAAVAIPAGASLIGSAISGRSARSAANTSADAQRDAARMAAEAQMFRPVGITSRFGSSQFTMGPDGYLESAGYTPSAEIQALQDRLSGLYQQGLGYAEGAGEATASFGPAAQRLFGLGSQFLPTDISRQASPEAMAQAERLYSLSGQVTPTSYDPTAAARSYFEESQALLDPARQREEARLSAGVFGRGRAGLNIGSQGQPELFALSQAREQQNAALAAQARERARAELQQDIGFGTQLGLGGLSTQQQAEAIARARLAEDIGLGTGLFGTGGSLLGQQYGLQTQALSPFQTQFGLAQLLEQAAQQPLDIGAQLGGRAATAGANVGQTLLAGGQNAAQLRLQGSLVGPTLMSNTLADLTRNPQFTQGIQGLFGSPASSNYYFPGNSNFGPSISRIPGGGFVGFGE